jgi:integrase/recombinase XerD
VSELVSLKVDELDPQAGIVRVQGKGGKVRIVPLDADTSAAIGQYLREVRPKNSDPSLFLSRTGRGFTRQGFWKIVKKYSKQAGLPATVSPHVLRHAFATHLMERGMSLRSLQMLLGHSDISTTEIYSHVSTSHLRQALEKHHPKSRK